MNSRSRSHYRCLRYESLESRRVLSVATPLVPVAEADGFDGGAIRATLPGDYNGNGTVGYDDLQTWRETYGQTVLVSGQRADGNQDGVIDVADFSVWRDNLGRSLDPASHIELADGSFIVRHANVQNANSLIVPEGETFTLAAESSFDYIEVHGTLRVSRDYDTTLQFIDLIIFDGGELDMGTADDPVLRKVDFIVKDMPIDLDIDPWQMGNGIINFGDWHAYGRKLDNTWMTLAAEIHAGDTELVLADAPVGWQVGDELLIPDTAQIFDTIRRESTVRIAAIDGNRISLDKPLDFEHLAVRDPSGNVRLMPYVANATRNIVIRSENPEGTRGHTIQLQQSEADIRYVSFLGLGRTLAEPLDNGRVVDGVVIPGTNQVARYAWHWHHVHPSHHAPAEHPHSGHLVGNFFDGSDIGKWGIVIHGTSDMHVADNITDRFVGAGIVTEDGNEFRNVIERNFVTGSFGYKENPNSKRAMLDGIPGGEGAGFWFHSSENVIRDNVAINNTIGYAVFNMMHPKEINVGSVPIDFSRNVALSNLLNGIETWRSPLEFVVQDATLANNGRAQFFFGGGESGSIMLRDVLILAQDGVSTGIHSSDAYTTGFEIYGGEILGCADGLMMVKRHYYVDGTVLQNGVNFNWSSTQRRNIPMVTLENVVSLGLPGLPVKHIETGEFNTERTEYSYKKNTGYRVLLNNWQLSGKNYVFYRPHAISSNPAVGLHLEEGLTLKQAWEKYGVSIDGGPMPEEAVQLADSDGFVLEYVGESPQIVLPVPRWILLTPNPMRARYTPESGSIYFRWVFTGAPVDSEQQFEIDGQLITKKIQLSPNGTSYTYFHEDGVWNAPGWHTVTTWRTLDGQMIAGSEMEFAYYVGV